MKPYLRVAKITIGIIAAYVAILFVFRKVVVPATREIVYQVFHSCDEFDLFEMPSPDGQRVALRRRWVCGEGETPKSTFVQVLLREPGQMKDARHHTNFLELTLLKSSDPSKILMEWDSSTKLILTIPKQTEVVRAPEPTFGVNVTVRRKD